MEELKVLLDQAAAETKFDMGDKGTSEYTSVTTFRGTPEETLSATEYREIVENMRQEDDLCLQTPRVYSRFPDKALNAISELLREILSDHVDVGTDTIGHACRIGSSSQNRNMTQGRSGIVSVDYVSSIQEFSEALIRGSVVLGSENMVSLLSHWLAKQSVQYQTYAILNGLLLKEKMNPLPGVYIESLPRSTKELPRGLPGGDGASEGEYLGHAILRMDTCSRPAFFHPGKVKKNSHVEVILPDGIELSAICQALSISSDGHVDVAFYWKDFSDVERIGSPNLFDTYGLGLRGLRSYPAGQWRDIDPLTGNITLKIDDKYVSILSDEKVRHRLETIASPKSKKLQTSITSWHKSKEPSRTFSEQFIDLRITLEGLYLKDFLGEYSQEMRFRLPLFGAWHLGTNFDERKEIRKTLRKIYDVASGAVHSGELEYSKENGSLLVRAQQLCLQGIEKMLDEGPPEDWGELILGSEFKEGTQRRNE